MGEINFQIVSQVSHTSVDCIKEPVLIKIILWIEPFFFQFSPDRFSNVQMRRVWRKKEDVQTSFLPVRHTLQNDFCLMQAGIIQYDKGLPLYPERKVLHIFQHKLSVYITFGSLPPAPALSVDETKGMV